MFLMLVIDKSPVTGGRSSQWFRGMRFWGYFLEYYPASYAASLTSFQTDTFHPLAHVWILFSTNPSRNKISQPIDRMFSDIILTVSPNRVYSDASVTDSGWCSTRYNWHVSNDFGTRIQNFYVEVLRKGCFGNFRHRRYAPCPLPYG